MTNEEYYERFGYSGFICRQATGVITSDRYKYYACFEICATDDEGKFAVLDRIYAYAPEKCVLNVWLKEESRHLTDVRVSNACRIL